MPGVREDFWQFKPSHHLWLATNHRPIISGTDLGFWSRIKLVSFTVTIPEDERDKQLAEKLQTEFPGILAWAVRGCLDWQRNGLQEPQEVLESTASYRDTMDVLGDFLAESCVISPVATVPKGELYDAYLRWGKSNGEHPLTKIDLASVCRSEVSLTSAQGTGGLALGLVAAYGNLAMRTMRTMRTTRTRIPIYPLIII